jgi:homocysteine S-methyltransferase
MADEFIQKDGDFVITIEVVPPVGNNTDKLMAELNALSGLTFNGFSVATNPVAKARMSAMATCSLIQKHTKRPAILHCTTRDHNRISLQGELWGAKALGLKTVMVATGDRVALADRGITSTVGDVTVYELIHMAREADLFTGVVLDTHPEINGLDNSIRRLERKVEAGAQYVVTQPVYDEAAADTLYSATKSMGIPIILGILPLRTSKHAEFLHNKVSGIAVPETIRTRMKKADNSVAEGNANAGEMLKIAREKFAGACIMPPFDHYEVLFDIIS